MFWEQKIKARESKQSEPPILLPPPPPGQRMSDSDVGFVLDVIMCSDEKSYTDLLQKTKNRSSDEASGVGLYKAGRGVDPSRFIPTGFPGWGYRDDNRKTGSRIPQAFHGRRPSGGFANYGFLTESAGSSSSSSTG